MLNSKYQYKHIYLLLACRNCDMLVVRSEKGSNLYRNENEAVRSVFVCVFRFRLVGISVERIPLCVCVFAFECAFGGRNTIYKIVTNLTISKKTFAKISPFISYSSGNHSISFHSIQKFRGSCHLANDAQ